MPESNGEEKEDEDGGVEGRGDGEGIRLGLRMDKSYG